MAGADSLCPYLAAVAVTVAIAVDVGLIFFLASIVTIETTLWSAVCIFFMYHARLTTTA